MDKKIFGKCLFLSRFLSRESDGNNQVTLSINFQERENAAHGLQCAVKLLLLLIRPNINDEKYSILESAIGFEPQLRDDVVCNFYSHFLSIIFII